MASVLISVVNILGMMQEENAMKKFGLKFILRYFLMFTHCSICEMWLKSELCDLATCFEIKAWTIVTHVRNLDSQLYLI